MLLQILINCTGHILYKYHGISRITNCMLLILHNKWVVIKMYFDLDCLKLSNVSIAKKIIISVLKYVISKRKKTNKMA